MTPSEEIIQRYARIERAADSFGRLIGVRKLKVSQQTKVSEWTPGLDGVTEIVLPSDPKTGEPERTVSIARRAQMLVVASVCEIDSIMRPFPRNRGELDALADALDEEGLVAAMTAYARFAPPKPAESEGEEGESAIDLAKK